MAAVVGWQNFTFLKKTAVMDKIEQTTTNCLSYFILELINQYIMPLCDETITKIYSNNSLAVEELRSKRKTIHQKYDN